MSTTSEIYIIFYFIVIYIYICHINNILYNNFYMRNPFRRKKGPRNPHLNMIRGADGRFVAGMNPDGSPVDARPDLKNLRAVTDYVREANKLNTELKRAALEDLQMRGDLAEMLGSAEDDIEGSEMPSMEQMFMQFLMNPQAFQGLIKPKQDPYGWGDPSVNTQTPPINPQPQDPQVRVTTPDQEKAQGVDRLNMVLKALSKLPIDRVNEGIVRKVAQSEGIDYEALQGTISKLAPVVLNGKMV